MIELMVVVVVMAILSGAIVPSIVSAARRTRVGTTATKVADLLNFAYAAAIARRQHVAINFDLERHVCWASVQGFSLPWLSEDEGTQPITLVSIEMPEGIEVSFSWGEEATPIGRSEAQRETILFTPYGTAQDVVIELADLSGDSRTLEVIGVTGEVRLSEER